VSKALKQEHPLIDLYRDSYPSGLGQTLVAMIPPDPARYRKWLEQKCAEYSVAEARLKKTVFTVTPAQACNGAITPLDASGLEGL
jgi:hypothetical protein